MRVLSLSITLFILKLSFLNAQILDVNNVKFGNVSLDELTMTTYPADDQADAVVLFDKGSLKMDYNNASNGFFYIQDRHIRIKILKSAATYHGDFIFRLEKFGSRSEKIENIRGVTSNLVDGEIRTTKLTKEGIFFEEVTDYLRLQNIAFPQVKEGSVIDLKYTLKSDFIFKLPTWYFQKSIPVDYSTYEVSIPEYFQYNLDMKGFALETLVENVRGESGYGYFMVDVQRVATVNGSPITNPTGARASRSRKRFDYETNVSRWTAIEVPKLKKEAYSSLPRDFYFRINFELSSLNFPGALTKSFTRKWDDVIETYKNISLNAYLKPRKRASELADEWTEGIDNKEEKLAAIFEKLRQTIEWNGTYSSYVKQIPADVLKSQNANSAELNYFLLSLLRSADFAVEPILISTRSNGALNYATPSLTQFNHVILKVTLGPDTYILVDAIDKACPLGLLPKQDLNDRGRLIKEVSSEWIDLSAPVIARKAIQLKLTLDESGSLAGTAKIKEEGYAAIELREKVQDENEVRSFLEDWTEGVFTNIEVNGLDNINEKISISSDVDFSEQLIGSGGLFYISPVLIKHFDENPFKSEARQLPVDFVMPKSYVGFTEIKLPEGMIVEELPEAIDFGLSEGKIRYSLSYMQMNGAIQVIEKITIKSPLVLSQDYLALRNFFDLMLEHQNKPLVVKNI